MSATAISGVFAWEALDSRGNPTVGCRVTLSGGAMGRAIVPSGASTGSHEARELRDTESIRFAGRGVSRAVASVIETLGPTVIGMDANDRATVDAAMVATDSDPRLGSVGANAVLGVSLAVMLAAADASGSSLWHYLSGSDRPLLPLPMVNIVSGGAHAGGALDIQDILVVPHGAESFAQAMEWVWRVRTSAASLVAQRGGPAALVADEGGLAAGFERNEDALALVAAAIEMAGLQPKSQVAIAVDMAATEFQQDRAYRLRLDDTTLDRHQWLDVVTGWCARYPIVSVEDVLGEDDWEGWHEATVRFGSERQVLGDDLFATDIRRLERGISDEVANAVLVKPNQAGSVTRAEEVVRRAQAAGYATVISARSGDTEDSWLADFAVGLGAGQIKVGSMTRSERTAKWNRLLEIEAHAGDQAEAAWIPGRSPVTS